MSKEIPKYDVIFVIYPGPEWPYDAMSITHPGPEWRNTLCSLYIRALNSVREFRHTSGLWVTSDAMFVKYPGLEWRMTQISSYIRVVSDVTHVDNRFFPGPEWRMTRFTLTSGSWATHTPVSGIFLHYHEIQAFSLHLKDKQDTVFSCHSKPLFVEHSSFTQSIPSSCHACSIHWMNFLAGFMNQLMPLLFCLSFSWYF